MVLLKTIYVCCTHIQRYSLYCASGRMMVLRPKICSIAPNISHEELIQVPLLFGSRL